MSANSATPAAFPLLNSIFVRPSLMEAHLTSQQLLGLLLVKDADELKQLKGKKGEKLARRWAPLLVHNLLHGNVIEDKAVLVSLEKAEGYLQAAAGSSWAAAFKKAGDTGVPPSALIRSMPKDAQRVLHADSKAWRETATNIERELSKCFCAAADAVMESYQGEADSGAVISLKKLAKMIPKSS